MLHSCLRVRDALLNAYTPSFTAFICWKTFAFSRLLCSVNSVAINIEGHAYTCLVSVSSSFGCVSTVEWLGHTMILCLGFWGPANMFPTAVNHLLLPPAADKRSSFSTSWPMFIYLFLIIAIPVGGEWYLIVVFMCIFLMADNFEHCSIDLFTIL